MTDQPTSVPTPEPAPDKSEEKTFTQAEVNAILKQRLDERKSKYADYDELKAAAEKLKTIEDAQKSETQKLQERLAQLEKQAGEAMAGRTEALIRAAAIAELSKVIPADRVSAGIKLLDKSTLKLGDGDAIEGLSAAIEAMLKENPFLKETAATTPPPESKPKISATNPAGTGGKTGGNLDWLNPQSRPTFGDGYLREPSNKG